SIALTLLGVGYPPGCATRFASITRDATPVATAAAMLVPLSIANFFPFFVTTSCGKTFRSELDRAASETSPTPGATTSGFAKPSYHVGPRELNHAIRSSSCDTVFLLSTAPTVMAEGALPGDRIPAYPST